MHDMLIVRLYLSLCTAYCWMCHGDIRALQHTLLMFLMQHSKVVEPAIHQLYDRSRRLAAFAAICGGACALPDSKCCFRLFTTAEEMHKVEA